MKLLADQDVYAGTVRFLSGLGHDVATAGQLGLAQAEDTELLRVAHEQGRIFVTRDRDFGGLVFVQGSGPGVIYLRILPTTQASVHTDRSARLGLQFIPTARHEYRPPGDLVSWPGPRARLRGGRSHPLLGRRS